MHKAQQTKQELGKEKTIELRIHADGMSEAV
jgi:hypothetical protein